jgi:tetratricopeptide (TPR) repeat protein
MFARHSAAASRARRLILVFVAAGAVLAVVLTRNVWQQAGRTAGADPAPAPSISPAEREAAAARPAGAQASAPRDYQLDRDMTASPEAFKFYAEGMELSRRLPVQAAARFRRAVMIDPGFAPAWYRLAMAGVLLSRGDDAAGAIRSAIQNQERLPEPYRSVAPVLAHFVAGAFDLAIAAQADALARQPSDPDLHFLAGVMCAASCDHFDPNGAVEHFEQVLSADPQYPTARAALMTAYGMKGMNDWSLTRALQYQSLNPQLIGAIANVGRVRIARGEYGDAIEVADEVVRRGEEIFGAGLAAAFILAGHNEQVAGMYDPGKERANSAAANAITHLHAGINDVWLGRFDRAAQHFERGAEFLPGPWERSGRALFFLLLGRTHALMGRAREADSAFEAAQQVAGPRPVLEYCLGVSKLKAGNVPEADRIAKRLAQEVRVSQPGWNEPWRRLLIGEIALASGETARAIDEFREAWRLERPLATDCIVEYTDAYFLDALGRAYLAAGKAQDALAAFDQIRALGIKRLNQPEISVLALQRCGRALEMLGRTEEARARYRQFLDLWSEAGGAPQEVAEAKARLGSGSGEIQPE